MCTYLDKFEISKASREEEEKMAYEQLEWEHGGKPNLLSPLVLIGGENSV